MIRKLAIAATTLVIAGCTAAEFNSINRQFNPSWGDSRLIDAKQRAIISIVKKNEDGTVDFKGVCAEPSPDALQATATALAGGGSSEEIQSAVDLALGSSDGAASFGLRTQSIQLLRDAYYRLCEGRLGGSIDWSTFRALQQRFQNHMVALLAVEQLTGATVGAQASISSNSKAETARELSLITRQIRAEADVLEQLQSEQSALENKIIADKAARKALADKNDKKQHDEEIAKLDGTIKANETRKTSVDKKVTLQTEVLGDLRALLASAQGDSNAAETGNVAVAKQSTASGTGMPAHVSDAVESITLNALNQDYTFQVCFEELKIQYAFDQGKRSSTPLSRTAPEKNSPAEAFMSGCVAAFKVHNDIRAKDAEAANERKKLLLERDKLIASSAEKVATRLAAGKITAEQAEKILAQLSAIGG